MPTGDEVQTSNAFQTRPVVCGSQKASVLSHGLQALGYANSALPKKISYSELARDKQSWQQLTQPASATTAPHLVNLTAPRSFDQAVCNVSSFTSQLREITCKGA